MYSNLPQFMKPKSQISIIVNHLFQSHFIQNIHNLRVLPTIHIVRAMTQIFQLMPCCTPRQNNLTSITEAKRGHKG